LLRAASGPHGKPVHRFEPNVAAVLAALAWTGFIAAADGGATFSLRRADGANMSFFRGR